GPWPALRGRGDQHPDHAPRRRAPGTAALRGTRRVPVAAYPGNALSLAALATAVGAKAARTVSWRESSESSPERMRTLRSRFVAIRVRPAGVVVQRHYRAKTCPSAG